MMIKIFLTLCFLPFGLGFGQSISDDHLTEQIAEYKVSGSTRLDALIQLGQQQKLPLGVVVAGNELFENISVSIQNGMVEEVIGAILNGVSGYHWSQKGKVIVVEPRSDKHEVLDSVIPEYKSQGATAQNLSNLLYMDFILQIDPTRQSFFGVDHPQATDKVQSSLEVRGATVETVLNEIVGRAGNIAWIAWPVLKSESLKAAS